ncbi:hypothetical protein [Actinomycetospora sp. NBC_00405]|uniref:hypothetical protein n=1 Tax=Actinomycetospora sp. NBC_00405 TaxID=2975952 RepID=UPI002E208B6E
MAAAIVSTVAAGAIAVTGATARAGDVPPPPVGTPGLAAPAGAPRCSTSEDAATDGNGAPADAGVEATTRPAADPG